MGSQNPFPWTEGASIGRSSSYCERTKSSQRNVLAPRSCARSRMTSASARSWIQPERYPASFPLRYPL